METKVLIFLENHEPDEVISIDIASRIHQKGKFNEQENYAHANKPKHQQTSTLDVSKILIQANIKGSPESLN